MNGGTITGNGIPTDVTPNGNGTTTDGVGIAVAQHTTKLPINVTINGGTISGYTALYQSDPENNGDEAIAKITMDVKGGEFRNTNGGTVSVYSENKSAFISGGYFSSDPSAYCVNGKTGIANTESNKDIYPFTVGVKHVDVETVVSAGNPAAKVEITDDKVTADSVKQATNDPATQTSLKEAATIAGLGNDESVVGTEADAKAALDADEDITVGESTVTVVIQPYLDVNVQSADTAAESSTMTVDITAKYNVVATTDPENINLEDGVGKNSVTLKTGETMTVTYPVTIKLPLPVGFVDSTDAEVYVNHIKGGKTYVYKATVEGNSTDGFTATFVNPHGFSTFVLTTETAASITDEGTSTTTYYNTLAEAVSAVLDGQTIKLEKANSETVTVAKDITFTLDKNGKTFSGEIKNGSYTTVTTTVNGDKITYTFDYTAPSYGGGSSGSSSYDVSVGSGIKHGSVSVSPKSANKGTTVTITVKPDNGYQLDTLTVTDKNGDTVKLTRKSDTQYTFTMPASKVTIKAAFAEIKAAPAHSFTDVPAGFWAEDAIVWAYEKGYVNGTSETTFNPSDNVSRQQLWMILARVSGQNPANMAEAKNWAVDNGISDGTNPGGSVTRQQMVAILYRYATLKGYNVSAKADLGAYPDAASVAGYAKDAMAWSVANGIVGGTTQGTLNPAGTATRAQFASILFRFCAKQ